jgi:hypothetical protein
VTGMVLALAHVGSTESPAGAINQDRGWTHLSNNDYPAGSGNPECQPPQGGGCYSWDDNGSYQTVLWSTFFTGFFSEQYRNSAARFVNPMPNLHSPFYAAGNAPIDDPVYVHATNLGDQLCGLNFNYRLNRPPNNHGCCQQQTIYASDVRLSYQKAYGIPPINPGVCDIRSTYDHENGHSLGLGHTTYGGQTMQTFNGPFGIGDGDARGVQCIYALLNCG